MPLGIPARYRRGTLRQEVTVDHLSEDVAHIDCFELLRGGETVWLALPGIAALRCRVERTDGFRALVVFEEPLHPAVLEALVGHRPHAVH